MLSLSNRERTLPELLRVVHGIVSKLTHVVEVPLHLRNIPR